MEDCFLASAALSMRVAIFSLREYIPIENLTIVERGIAAKEGRLKIKGTAIGTRAAAERGRPAPRAHRRRRARTAAAARAPPPPLSARRPPCCARAPQAST